MQYVRMMYLEELGSGARKALLLKMSSLEKFLPSSN